MQEWYQSFDAYVADYPQAERLREWLTQRGKAGVIFIKAHTPSNLDFPGGYWALRVLRWPQGWVILVQNLSEYALRLDVPSQELGAGYIIGLSSLAPINVEMLEAKGFNRIIVQR